MRINDPFEHKCPYCGCDLYSHIMGKALQKAINGSDFSCPCCNKTLSWKDTLCKRHAKHILIVLFVLIGLFVISTVYAGPVTALTVSIMGLAAILCIALLFCLLSFELINGEE